ncbi:MAG: hypothetical protein IKU52_07690 [Clostridia bacterium]|nr:hypothetical protein [Clostridia bacterium]
MRKIIITLLLVVTSIITLLPVNALRGQDITNSISEEFKEEQEAVKQAVENTYQNWPMYLGSNIEDIDFNLMFQCYNLEDYDIVSAYKKNGNFGDNILDSYVWIVPNYRKGGEVEVVEFKNGDYSWKIRAGKRLKKYDNIPNIDIENLYDRIFQEYPECNSESIRVIKYKEHDCKIIYFVNDGVEYVSPFFYIDDPVWAKSGEIYTAANFIAKITENESKITESDTNFISFVKANVDYIIIGSAVLFVGVLVLGIVISKKKKAY